MPKCKPSWSQELKCVHTFLGHWLNLEIITSSFNDWPTVNSHSRQSFATGRCRLRYFVGLIHAHSTRLWPSSRTAASIISVASNGTFTLYNLPVLASCGITVIFVCILFLVIITCFILIRFFRLLVKVSVSQAGPSTSSTLGVQSSGRRGSGPSNVHLKEKEAYYIYMYYIYMYYVPSKWSKPIYTGIILYVQ